MANKIDTSKIKLIDFGISQKISDISVYDKR